MNLCILITFHSLLKKYTKYDYTKSNKIFHFI